MWSAKSLLIEEVTLRISSSQTFIYSDMDLMETNNMFIKKKYLIPQTEKPLTCSSLFIIHEIISFTNDLYCTFLWPIIIWR